MAGPRPPRHPRTALPPPDSIAWWSPAYIEGMRALIEAMRPYLEKRTRRNPHGRPDKRQARRDRRRHPAPFPTTRYQEPFTR